MSNSLPPVPIYGTWDDFVQVLAVDDQGPVDLSAVTEVTLRVIDPYTGFDEMNLKLSQAEIVVTADAGLIEWSVELGVMRTFAGKLYRVLLLVEENINDTTIVLLNAPMSITDSGGTVGAV